MSGHITTAVSEGQDSAGISTNVYGGMDENPQDMKVLPGILPIVARSRSEAQEKEDLLEKLVPERVGIDLVSSWCGIDLSTYDIDGPRPSLPDDSTDDGQRTNLERLRVFAKEDLTIREMARRIANAGTGPMIAGIPSEIADQMEAWYSAGAADGLALMFPLVREDWVNFTQHVVPELQRRRLGQEEYQGVTFRERLGLPRPISRFTQPNTSVAGVVHAAPAAIAP